MFELVSIASRRPSIPSMRQETYCLWTAVEEQSGLMTYGAGLFPIEKREACYYLWTRNKTTDSLFQFPGC